MRKGCPIGAMTWGSGSIGKASISTLAKDFRKKITEDGDDAPSIPVTSLQRKHLEYLREPHSTTEMMAHFGKNESAIQQVTRTIRLMGLVESIGYGSSSGHGGCWKLWKSTEEGVRMLEVNPQ